MTKRIFALLMALLLALSVFAACDKKDDKDKKDENPLLGEWKCTNDDFYDKFVFGEDMMLRMYESDGEVMEFEYKYEDENKVFIDDWFVYEIDGDKLTLTEEDYTLEFVKIK